MPCLGQHGVRLLERYPPAGSRSRKIEITARAVEA